MANHLTAEDGEALWARTKAKIDAAKAETSMSNNIVVLTRVRPFNQRERDLNMGVCVEMFATDPASHQCCVTDPASKGQGPSTFRFDYCFDSFDPNAPTFIDQRTVFESVGLDILAKAWSGYNACLFAYGQTGSGKVRDGKRRRMHARTPKATMR
jgi:hypothetical protein